MKSKIGEVIIGVIIAGGVIEVIGGIIINNFYLILLGLMFIIGGIDVIEKQENKEKIRRYEKLCIKQQETIRKQNEVIRKLLN